MGKGKRQGQVGDQDKAYANKQEGVQDTARNADTPFIDSLIPGGVSGGAPGGVGGLPTATPAAPGGSAMSPYAAAQYGSDIENVNRVYQNLRQNAMKSVAATMGTAPGGREASTMNTLNRGQAEDLTTAFRTGQKNTLNEGLTATGILENRQNMYNPTGARNAATSSYAASDAARSAQINGIVNDALGVAGAATGFARLAKPGAAPNPGGLPGGSTNVTPLPLGSPGSAFSLDQFGGMSGTNSSGAPGTGGTGFSGLSRMSSRYAKTGPGLWAGGA